MMKKNLNILKALLLLMFMAAIPTSVWADDFTVERAVNLGQLDSWADISQFQWQEIDHAIQDNSEEMDALINLFYDPAPKDTVGFYNQIYAARDNQYIVLRLDKAQNNRPFYVRVTVVKSKDDPSQNSSKLYAVDKYAYIMPPIGEMQLEVKIWPRDEGEEMAKTYTFHSHSYGSMSLRTVMLDKSRIVPGNYDLQLIYYDKETEKSDTTYVPSLLTDKLYTFYTYNNGKLKEAYMRCDNFKRIKLRPEWWAVDAVTHVNDNSVTVMSGDKMPYNQHKRMDAPNPTYLDSRLFSHHDTLWVNLYLDNVRSTEVDGLTMHAVLADFDNNPVGDKLLTWGKDPVTDRLYVLTDGEPATIECYRDGYLPKLCMYPGSYDHITGVISRDSEEADIYLQSINAPVTSPTVTTAILSTLTPTVDLRGGKYICDIQESDILPTPLTETVFYDEYASHKDTAKIANGIEYDNYAAMEVAIVAPNNVPNTSVVSLKKVKGAEKNDIKTDNLTGESRVIYSPLYDYSYWTLRYDLNGYLDVNKSGRPAVAFDGTEVRQLPILANVFLDTDDMKKQMENAADERMDPKESGTQAEKWMTEKAPAAGMNMSLKIPKTSPYYVRWGFSADLFKAKKITVSYAIGAGVDFDFLKKDKDPDAPPTDPPSYSVTSSTYEEVGYEHTDASDIASPIIEFLGGNGIENPKEKDPNKLIQAQAGCAAFVEQYNQLGLPLTSVFSSDGDNWAQLFLGLELVDELSIRGNANIGFSCRIDFMNALAAIWPKPKVGDSWATKAAKWFGSNKITKALNDFFGVSIGANAGAQLNASAGIFAFHNLDDAWAPWKNHIIGFRFSGQAFFNLKLKAKIDAIIAGAEGGASLGAGINFKYAAGSRLDFRNGFSGSAYSWYAGMGLYYKVKFFGWSKYGEFQTGRLNAKQELIKPKSYKNPFDPNFLYFLSDLDDPRDKLAGSMMRRANSELPGMFMTNYVDYDQPVKFVSGGDSVIYQVSYENPNDYAIEVASSGDPVPLSDSSVGGCSDYDAASVPGTDLVVMEQAVGWIAQEDLEDSLHLDETVKRASRVYSIYYTKKKTGTKWYRPKPVYSSTETTSYKPRVAVAENGTGVAIWQEGLLGKGSWVTEKDTTDIADLVMTGQLMMSRYDGNETWTAPVPLMAVGENCILKDYRVTYDGSTAFVIVRKSDGTKSENVCMTVDAGNNITSHDVDQSDVMMNLRRVGNHNLLAWTSQPDSLSNSTFFQMKSYDMSGKPDQGINTSFMLENTEVEDFRIIPDLEAKSLDNVALLWRETNFAQDSTLIRLRAARLVPNKDGGFGFGTPITAVQIKDNNDIYGFDGFMTKEKIQVCYVAADSLGNSQLNKTAAYFGNAFNYTIAFDNDNNQGFQCDKDEINLLVTVDNYGTSTISECVLAIGDQQYPLNMKIPAGNSAQERITIPYIIGTGVNTTMYVKYDDVLGIQEQSYARYMARRRARMDGINRRTAEEKTEDATYEQQTKAFYPYHPRLECFVAAQHVHENGDNHITICVRNYARRQSGSDFAYIVGLKENAHSPVVYIGGGEGHIQYDTKMIFNTPEEVKGDGGCMHDFGSYRAGYVTITVPNVTEKKEMFVGATLVYKDPKSGWYMQLTPDYNSDSKNGVVTLYPSSEVVSVKNIYNNDDAGNHMRVSRQGSNLLVTGAEPRQQVRLYQANGAIMGRQQADESGRVTFTAPGVSGVGLISTDKETVKFAY